MARLDNSAVRMAKANVDRWIVDTPAGPAFLPGNGQALPMSDDVARAIRAGAEAHIFRSYDTMQKKMWLHIVLFTATFVAVQFAATGQQPGVAAALKYLSYGLYSLHGALALIDAWKWERTVFDLRDAIALALRGKVPLAPHLAGPRAIVEPNHRVLGTIVFATLAPFFVLKGVTLPTAIPEWVPAVSLGVAIGVMVWVAGHAWLQKSGLLAPEDRTRHR